MIIMQVILLSETIPYLGKSPAVVVFVPPLFATVGVSRGVDGLAVLGVLRALLDEFLSRGAVPGGTVPWLPRWATLRRPPTCPATMLVTEFKEKLFFFYDSAHE